MTTEPNINSQPIVFEATHAALREIATQAATITLAKDGEAKVSRARKDLKGWRTKIETRRKALKADALEYGRRVDQAARELTAIIEPEERRLEAEENALAEQRAKEQREADERRRVENDKLRTRDGDHSSWLWDSGAESNGRRLAIDMTDVPDAEREALAQKIQDDLAEMSRRSLEHERLRAKAALADEVHQHWMRVECQGDRLQFFDVLRMDGWLARYNATKEPR